MVCGWPKEPKAEGAAAGVEPKSEGVAVAGAAWAPNNPPAGWVEPKADAPPKVEVVAEATLRPAL